MHSDVDDLKQAKEYHDDAPAILLERLLPDYVDVKPSLVKIRGGLDLLSSVVIVVLCRCRYRYRRFVDIVAVVVIVYY